MGVQCNGCVTCGVCAKGWVCKGVHVWGGGRAMLRVWQAVGVRCVCKGGVCKAEGVQCDGGVIDGCACVRPWVCNALSVQGWECAMQRECNGCAKVGR